jgi:hypothetical protein
MTNLPATFKEAKEVAVRARAQELVKENCEPPYGCFQPDTERIYGKRAMKWFVTQLHLRAARFAARPRHIGLRVERR